MEPTGPISSRGTPATQLLDSLTTVQPLMWSLELERANHRYQSPSGIEVRSPYRTVWREIAERSRQRGTEALTGKDWPGAVFLPAWIVHKLMTKGALTAPASWKPLDSGSASKLISLLGGWQQDRGLYEFSVLPSKIIRQGEVNVVLDLKAFAGMPSYAIYIDLESVRDPIGADSPELADDIPPGFLVGLNIHKDVPELVMVSLKNNQVLVETLPLDGSSLDAHAARLHAKVGPGKSGRLSIMISALLMICLHRTKIEQVHDGASEYGVLKVWNRWRVGESFNDTITRAYRAAKLRQPGIEPCIVAHWGPVGDTASGVTLRCTMGTSIDWKKFSSPKKVVTEAQGAVAEATLPSPGPVSEVEAVPPLIPEPVSKKPRKSSVNRAAPATIDSTPKPKKPKPRAKAAPVVATKRQAVAAKPSAIQKKAAGGRDQLKVPVAKAKSVVGKGRKSLKPALQDLPPTPRVVNPKPPARKAGAGVPVQPKIEKAQTPKPRTKKTK